MPYAIFHSQTFDGKLRAFPKEFQEWVDKMETQLTENPYVGDPIRVRWFREKKHDNEKSSHLTRLTLPSLMSLKLLMS